MSSYRHEHNISGEESDSEQSTEHRETANNRGYQHPTLSQALDQFMADRAPLTYDQEARQMMESMMSYIAPEGVDQSSTRLFETMMSTLTASPDAMMVFGGGKEGSGGVDNQFLDTLDRVDLGKLPKDTRCPICTNDFRDAEYPLVVRLPCDAKHCFDLECISPWLKVNRTCPLCREDVTTVRQRRLEAEVKKAKEAGEEDEDEEEDWGMYG